MLKRFNFGGLTAVLFLICNCSIGQNLIPDPGFENWDGTQGNYMAPLYDWYDVNGTPDHHHIANGGWSNLTGLDTLCGPGNGQTQCGFPCEGQGTGGFYKANGETGSKEWAGTELLEPLEEGTCYTVSFWINNKKDNPDFIMETNFWGVCFSETMMPSFDPNTQDFDDISNQWVHMEDVADGSDWIYWEETFYADAPYAYAFVGYQGNVSESTTNAWSQSGSVGFYVWIDKVSVVPLTAPNISIEGLGEFGPSICVGDSILFYADEDYDITWSDGINESEEDAFWFVGTDDGTATITAAFAYTDQCVATEEVEIEVIDCSCPWEVSTIQMTADTLACPLDGNCHGEVQVLISGGTAPYNYNWVDRPDIDGAIGKGLCNGEICIELSDSESCEETVCIELEFPERWTNPLEFGLPNVFTPNEDEFNDTFQFVQWIGDQPVIPNDENGLLDEISDYELSIFNRWGEVVFETQNPAESWDGKMNNEEASSGTYYYVLTYSQVCFEDEPRKSEGAFTLVRNTD